MDIKETNSDYEMKKNLDELFALGLSEFLTNFSLCTQQIEVIFREMIK